jgi:hypothetical protein
MEIKLDITSKTFALLNGSKPAATGINIESPSSGASASGHHELSRHQGAKYCAAPMGPRGAKLGLSSPTLHQARQYPEVIELEKPRALKHHDKTRRALAQNQEVNRLFNKEWVFQSPDHGDDHSNAASNIIAAQYEVVSSITFQRDTLPGSNSDLMNALKAVLENKDHWINSNHILVRHPENKNLEKTAQGDVFYIAHYFSKTKIFEKKMLEPLPFKVTFLEGGEGNTMNGINYTVIEEPDFARIKIPEFEQDSFCSRYDHVQQLYCTFDDAKLSIHLTASLRHTPEKWAEKLRQYLSRKSTEKTMTMRLEKIVESFVCSIQA